MGSLRTLNSDKHYDDYIPPPHRFVEYHLRFLESALLYGTNPNYQTYYYPDMSNLIPVACHYGLLHGYLVRIKQGQGLITINFVKDRR
jgi:hypothetical protein